MSHVPHELAAEFPELKDRIHEMKIGNGHFARLFDEYHDINREVHRVEAAGINTDDATFEDLKLKRLNLKDELYKMLQG